MEPVEEEDPEVLDEVPVVPVELVEEEDAVDPVVEDEPEDAAPEVGVELPAAGLLARLEAPPPPPLAQAARSIGRSKGA